MLKLKLQYFGYLMRRAGSLEKTLTGKDWRQVEKGTTEDEMIDWHHQLLEFTQTQVHWVSDAIQPSHPLLSPSPPAFSVSQHQGLFKWVSSSHRVAKVLEFQLQHLSFQWIFRTDFLYNWLVGSPCSPRDCQESSPIPQFKNIYSSVLSFLYSPTLTSIHDHWKNHSLDYMDLCWQSNVSAFEYAV